jgi:SAM-dependent methyltransferase
MLSHRMSHEDVVAAQYERYVYPEPVLDLGASADLLYECDPFLRATSYWPRAPRPERLDILVAGCGANAAARYAWLHPGAQVVGLDFSRASLAHEDRLRIKHGLKNLELIEGRIEDTRELLRGRDFDFIETSGVLHHLPDPARGLASLAPLLRRDGVMFIMLYAKYGRAGLYMLQELFRMLALPQNSEGVLTVRECLLALSPDHPVRPYLQRSNDLEFDTTIVDAFLHRCDRPYTVADCLALVASAGLVHQGWIENDFYYPEGLLSGHGDIYGRIAALPEPAMWEAMELIGWIARHGFYVCRAERDPASYRLHFDGPALLDEVPEIAPGTKVESTLDGSDVRIRLNRPASSPVTLDGSHARALAAIDGRRSVRACCERAGAGTGGAGEDMASFARDLFRTLWRVGYVHLAMPG